MILRLDRRLVAHDLPRVLLAHDGECEYDDAGEDEEHDVED
jgi:hypothetical protein